MNEIISRVNVSKNIAYIIRKAKYNEHKLCNDQSVKRSTN